MSAELFINDINPLDDYYRLIRDEKRSQVVKLKSYMENLWNIYYPYADKDFRSQLAQDFHARFWEMYLTCTLLAKSHKVVPKMKRYEGPDILVQDLPRRIFIEAVAPSEGSEGNPDKVPKLKLNEVTRVPDTKITLRYSGAIVDKYKKYYTYLNRCIISSSDSQDS